MNNINQSFTEQFFKKQGATFANFQIRFAETPADFSALEQKTTVSVLLYHSLLRVSSADNLKFLQGQFTCDVKEVSTTQWRYGAMCTNKGRMIANFLLYQNDDNQHLIRVSTSTREILQNTLKKFSPFYKGVLDELGNEYVLLGLNGVNANDLVKQIFSTVPDVNGALQTEQAIVIRLSENRFECWVKNQYLETLWPTLATQTTPTGCAYWELLNIRSGLGEVRQPTIEEWTPHMLNLQAIGAISFKKGCYTGQEIVARTEYRGQQKRAMYRVTGQGNPPFPATPILDGEQNAGEIVMAQWSTVDHWEGLAVLSDKHLERLACNGQGLQMLTLPYSVK